MCDTCRPAQGLLCMTHRRGGVQEVKGGGRGLMMTGGRWYDLFQRGSKKY